MTIARYSLEECREIIRLLPYRRYSAEFEAKHPRDEIGQFAEKARPTKEEFESKALSEEESMALVAKLRAGDDRSKNKGRVNVEPKTGRLVETQIPLSLFTDDYRKYIEESTNADRVANYVDAKPSDPVYALPRRKSKGVWDGWQVSDGGHRLMAAIKRGDKTISALVPVDSYDKLT